MTTEPQTATRVRSVPGRFNEAHWPEPLVHSMGDIGVGGFGDPPLTGDEMDSVEEWLSHLPASLRRQADPRNPELGEPVVLRHFERLSQMVLAPSVASNIGQATCTVKYNPVLGEELTRELRRVHPSSDDETIQGLLSLVWQAGEWLKLLSGFDAVSFAPSGGAHGVFTNAKIIAKYHADRGDAGKRDEIITTIFSHPCDASTPSVAGFRVITLFPGQDGMISVDALRAAVSERTAGLMICNPEDTGLYNPRIQEMTEIVRRAGGICATDQANANGVLGLIRPADMGFDLCQYNLHKTFATPHGALGLACGPVLATEKLAYLLPGPVVCRDGSGQYYRDVERPGSVGLVRAHNGNVPTVIKALAWLERLGLDGVRSAARLAVANNAYLTDQVTAITGASVSYPGNTSRRLEQTRYTWQELYEETGIDTEEIEALLGDYGIQSYWTSHHPYVVPQPFTLEPTETVTRPEMDEYASALSDAARLAREAPEVIRRGPTKGAAGRIAGKLAGETITTWRALQALQAR
jgi:glycine dehydrogenase subunit 2